MIQIISPLVILSRLQVKCCAELQHMLILLTDLSLAVGTAALLAIRLMSCAGQAQAHEADVMNIEFTCHSPAHQLSNT